MNRIHLPLIVLSLCLTTAAAAFGASSIVPQVMRVAGVPVNVVTIDLNDPNIVVTPAVAKGGIGTYEPFRALVRRTHPTAAICGTYYGTRTFLPTGDIVIDSQLIYDGYLGTAVTITGNNKVKFVPAKLYNWSDYDKVITAGPTLLLRGKTIVYPKAEGYFSSTHQTSKYRASVGLTAKNKLLFVTTRRKIHMRKMAQIMRTLKCVDAVTLDGGSSTALYCKGRVYSSPGRAMTNCLLVYDSPVRYSHYKNRLYPDGRYAKAPSHTP